MDAVMIRLYARLPVAGTDDQRLATEQVKGEIERLSAALKKMLGRAETAEAEIERLRAEVEHWRVKAECYGGMVHGITPVLAKAGFPVEEFAKDGNLGAIPRAVSRMAAEVERLKAALKELRDWFEGWQDFHMSSRWVAKIDAALEPGKEG